MLEFSVLNQNDQSWESTQELIEDYEKLALSINQNTQSAYTQIRVNPYSKASLADISKLSNDKISNIQSSAKEILSQLQLLEGDFSEKKMLKTFLAKKDFSVPNEFWSSLSEEDVVEVYSANMEQVYRSFNFFKYCGYSLLDLSIYDWQSLWERPSFVMQQMQAYAIDALQGNFILKKVDIIKHIVRETFNSGLTAEFTPRVCRMSFNYIAPVFKREHIAGFIVTSRGELLLEGHEALDLRFL